MQNDKAKFLRMVLFHPSAPRTVLLIKVSVQLFNFYIDMVIKRVLYLCQKASSDRSPSEIKYAHEFVPVTKDLVDTKIFFIS